MTEMRRVAWRKSSYTTANGHCVEIALIDARWRTSSHSAPNGHCVEVVPLGSEDAAIRDSKNPRGPVLALTHEGLRGLVHAARTVGRGDHRLTVIRGSSCRRASAVARLWPVTSS